MSVLFLLILHAQNTNIFFHVKSENILESDSAALAARELIGLVATTSPKRASKVEYYVTGIGGNFTSADSGSLTSHFRSSVSLCHVRLTFFLRKIPRTVWLKSRNAVVEVAQVLSV